MARLPDIGVSEWLTYQAQQFGEAARQVTEGGLFEIFASGPEFSVPQDLTMPWDVEPELADLAEEEARLEAQRRQQEFERQAEEARQYLAQQQQTYGGLNDGAVGHASQLGPAGAGGNLEAPTPGQNGAGGANPEVQAFLTQAGQIDQARGLVNPEVAAFQTAAGAIERAHTQGARPATGLDDTLRERQRELERDGSGLLPDGPATPGPNRTDELLYQQSATDLLTPVDERGRSFSPAPVQERPPQIQEMTGLEATVQERAATPVETAPVPAPNPVVAKLEEIGQGLANAFKGLAEALTSGANQANDALVGGLNRGAEVVGERLANDPLGPFKVGDTEIPQPPIGQALKAGVDVLRKGKEVFGDESTRNEQRLRELSRRPNTIIPDPLAEGEPLSPAEEQEYWTLLEKRGLDYGANEPMITKGVGTAAKVLSNAEAGDELFGKMPNVVQQAGEFVGDLARAGGRGLRGPSIVSSVIPENVARRTPTQVELPTDPYIRAAIENSGGQFTDEGIVLNVIRHQNERAELKPAVRGGVFYEVLPPGSEGSYKTDAPFSRVGGASRIEGQTLIKHPLVVRSGDVITDGLKKLGLDVTSKDLTDQIVDVIDYGPRGVPKWTAGLRKILQEHGGDPRAASRIVTTQPNQEEWMLAVQENILTSNARKQGYDSILTYEIEWPSKRPVIQEMTDIRESHFPTAEGQYRMYPEFRPPAKGGSVDVADEGTAALRAEAERLSQGPRGRGGVPGAQGIVGEDTTRMYHGTGSAFDAPTADKFDANGLFGPGYYLTSDPRVAGSYAVERAMPNKNLRGTAALDPEVTAAGANVRPVDVPRGLRLFDVEAGGGRGWEADEELRDLIGDIGQMGRWDELPDGQRAWEDFEEALRYNANGEVPTNADVWHALKDAVGPTDVNRILANAGYDGIRYSGGRRIPMMDSTGKPIEHEVVVTFPESLQKIRNALSGTPGGLVAREQAEPNPVVSQALGRGLIGSGYGAVAGGIQAAQQEDADLGSVAAGVGRGAVAGAARGAIGGAAQAGLTRGQAGRLGALGMRAVPERAPGEGLDDAQRAQRVLRDQPLPPGALPITLSTPEEIGRLRLDKFPDEVREDVQQAATRVDWARDQRRGVLPDAVVAEMAEDLARRGDAWLAGRRPGRAFNPEETVAVRNLVTGQALKVRELTEEIASARASQTTPDLLIAQRAAEASKLDALVKLAEGARAEAGRALRQYRLETQLIELDPTQAVERIYKRLGGRDDALTKIDEYNTLVQQGADPFQMAHFWARVESPPPNFPEWFAALRYNSMLSGPRTFEINTIGNLSEVPWRLARDIGASTLRGRPEEIAPELVGLWVGAQKGAAAFMETLQHGITLEQATRGDMPRSLASRLENPAARGAATFLEAPGRLMQATDEFGRQLAYSMGLYRQAAIKASKTGKRGTEWGAEVARLAADPSEGMMRAAINIADRMTFKGEMGALGTALGGVQRVPVLGNILLPFLRTVYHLTARGVDRSPLGIVGTGIDVARGAYRGGQTPKGAAPLGERLGDNAMGMMGGLFLTGQAMQGNISGAGPDDPQKRDMLRAQGWQPYSVRIGNAWVSYANWGPAAIPFSLAAGVAESQLYRKPDATTAETVVDAFRRFGELTTEQTYFQGIGAFYKAVKEPDVYGSAWLTQFMQTLIPYGSAINTVGQATDPYARRPERFNVEQAMKARFPGLREQVPTATDPLGRSVENTMRGGGAFQPLRLSPEKRDPLLRTFSQAGVDIGAPPKELTVRGERVKLSESEKRYYQQVMAEYLSERYADAATAGDPQRALQRILREARERAERTIVRERP